MIVVLSTDGNLSDSTIAKRFGHAKYFLFFDTESGTYNPVENQHDHSHANLEAILAKGIKTFITGNIGPNAFSILDENGAEVLLARNMRAGDAVKAYLAGELTVLKEPTIKKSIGHGTNGHHDEHNPE